MGKARDTKTDVPRRIYASTIERIDKHLEASPRKTKTGKRKEVKGDFNKFLEVLIDSYEELQNAKRYYTNSLHEEVETARGEAVLMATKTKKPFKVPKVVVVISEDQL